MIPKMNCISRSYRHFQYQCEFVIVYKAHLTSLGIYSTIFSLVQKLSL